MNISIPYGQRQLKVTLNVDALVLEPKRQTIEPIGMALAAPIGSPLLHELVHAGQSIAIVTSDITRPCPTDALLPPLMEELAQAGVRDEDVTVVFALGIHRVQTPEERARLVGPEMAMRLRCIDSDPDEVVHVGTTSRGTPIEVFKQVVKADLRIALGSVEPHYFAGYSGGAKALVPGVCSKTTIQHNHSMMVQPGARTGVLDGNPVREDIEEGAALIRLDFILNVILDGDHNVVAAAAGHPIEAHRWACRVLDYHRKITVEQPADIVIVSAGGYPKDINLYQAHKALENAAVVVRPGGTIIWVAECSEGLGNATFEEWIVGASGDDILTRIQQDFVLGGHKAAAIARVLKRAKVSLVSALPPELVRACGITPYADLEKALSEALQEMETDPVLVFMPEGGAVIPMVGAKCEHPNILSLS